MSGFMNEASWDRIVRVGVGIALIAVGFSGAVEGGLGNLPGGLRVCSADHRVVGLVPTVCDLQVPHEPGDGEGLRPAAQWPKTSPTTQDPP